MQSPKNNLEYLLDMVVEQQRPFFKTKKKGINCDCDLTRYYEADKNEKHKTYKNLHRDGDIYERLYNTERCLEVTVQLDRKASNKEVHMFAFNNYAEFLKWKLRSTLKFDNKDIEWVKSIHWQGGETGYLKVLQFNRFQNYLEWSGAHQKLQVHALEIVWRVPEIFSMNTVLTCAEEKNMVLQWLRRYNCVTSHWYGSWEALMTMTRRWTHMLMVGQCHKVSPKSCRHLPRLSRACVGSGRSYRTTQEIWTCLLSESLLLCGKASKQKNLKRRKMEPT